MLINPVNLARRASLALRRDATLADLADRLGSMHGDAVVVEELPDGGAARQITHRQAAETVARWSAAVAARSPVGRPVVVATPNTFDQLLISLAVSRAGGLPAPVNSQMSAVEVDHVIADSGATLVIRDAAELDTGPGSRTEPRSPHRAAPGDVAALFYKPGPDFAVSSIPSLSYDYVVYEWDDLAGLSSVPYTLTLPANTATYLWAFADVDNDGVVNEAGEPVASSLSDVQGRVIVTEESVDRDLGLVVVD